MLWGHGVKAERVHSEHAHTMHELVLCQSSTGRHSIAEQMHDFSPGKMFFLPEHVPHYVWGDAKRPAIFLYICFDAQHFAQGGPARVHDIVERLVAQRIFAAEPDEGFARENLAVGERLAVELASRELCAEEKVHFLLGELLVNFYRMQRFNEAPEHRYRHAILQLCDRLKERVRDTWSLEEAAMMAGMSRALFAREFKNVMGVTYVAYLQRLRIERARELLSRSRLSVTQVGLAAGFQHAGHFHNTFRKFVHMTPRAYRQWVRERGPFAEVLKVTSRAALTSKR